MQTSNAARITVFTGVVSLAILVGILGTLLWQDTSPIREQTRDSEDAYEPRAPEQNNHEPQSDSANREEKSEDPKEDAQGEELPAEVHEMRKSKSPHFLYPAQSEEYGLIVGRIVTSDRWRSIFGPGRTQLVGKVNASRTSYIDHNRNIYGEFWYKVETGTYRISLDHPNPIRLTEPLSIRIGQVVDVGDIHLDSVVVVDLLFVDEGGNPVSSMPLRVLDRTTGRFLERGFTYVEMESAARWLQSRLVTDESGRLQFATTRDDDPLIVVGDSESHGTVFVKLDAYEGQNVVRVPSPSEVTVRVSSGDIAWMAGLKRTDLASRVVNPPPVRVSGRPAVMRAEPIEGAVHTFSPVSPGPYSLEIESEFQAVHLNINVLQGRNLEVDLSGPHSRLSFADLPQHFRGQSATVVAQGQFGSHEATFERSDLMVDHDGNLTAEVLAMRLASVKIRNDFGSIMFDSTELANDVVHADPIRHTANVNGRLSQSVPHVHRHVRFHLHRLRLVPKGEMEAWARYSEVNRRGEFAFDDVPMTRDAVIQLLVNGNWFDIHTVGVTSDAIDVGQVDPPEFHQLTIGVPVSLVGDVDHILLFDASTGHRVANVTPTQAYASYARAVVPPAAYRVAAYGVDGAEIATATAVASDTAVTLAPK